MKNKVSQKHQNGNKDKDKAKCYNTLLTNKSLPQIQASKKNKCHRSCQKGYPVTEVNATWDGKENKNKAKDLSHIKCYAYKQKDYYANKYLKKAKN